MNGKIVAIGASTGGVEAVLAILTQFPATLPADRGDDTPALAVHAARSCSGSTASASPKCKRPSRGAPLTPGRIYIAPGTYTHLEIQRGEGLRCVLREGDLVSGHRPSVDALFLSVAKAAGAKAVGVILTGMGSDGAKGLLEMRRAGASTVGQDEATSRRLRNAQVRLSARRGGAATAARSDRCGDRRTDGER